VNDRVTIFWHIERMSETAPLTLHQADEAPTNFHIVAIESDVVVDRIAGATAAEGLGEDTVDLGFLGCRPASYLDLRDLIDPVEIPEHDATTIPILKKGIEHEKRHLPSLKA
jgi:hypothetical protein